MANIKMKDLYKEDEQKIKHQKTIEAKEQKEIIKKSKVPLVLTIIFIVIALFTLPLFFKYFYQMGAGHAFSNIMDESSELSALSYDSLLKGEEYYLKNVQPLKKAFEEKIKSKNIPQEIDRYPYMVKWAKAEGVKSAIFMTLGQHIPFYFFILITIGFLTNSLSYKFKRFLRFSFFGVWLFGMIFLSLGVQYWGLSPQFPESLVAAFLIYLVAVGFFGIIIKIGKAINKKIVSNK